jgi:hypothetical protein
MRRKKSKNLLDSGAVFVDVSGEGNLPTSSTFLYPEGDMRSASRIFISIFAFAVIAGLRIGKRLAPEGKVFFATDGHGWPLIENSIEV